MPKYNVVISYAVTVKAEDESEAETEAYKIIDTYAMEPKVDITEDDE